MAKITYNNKTALITNPDIADENKVTDNDMNEIKSVVNENDDKFLTNGLNVSNEVDEDYRVNLIKGNDILPPGTIHTLTSGSVSLNFEVPKANTQYTMKTNLPSTDGSALVFFGSGADAQVNSVTNGVWEGSPKTMTSDANKYVTIAFRYLSGYANIKLSDYWFTLVEGTTAQDPVLGKIVVDNEKYTDTLNVGTSLDSRSRVNVLHSKNLFDKDNANALVGFINASNNQISGNSSALCIIVPIKSSTTYTIKKTKGNRFAIGTCNSYPAIGITLSNVWDDRTQTQHTFTSASNSNYLVIYLTLQPDDDSWSDILNSIMVNEGSTALPYEPYITPSIYVDNEEIYSKDNMEQYSTGEIRIGTWIDGKPLYRKVIEITNPTLDAWANVNHNISNMDFGRIVDANITRTVYGTTSYIPIGVSNISAGTLFTCDLQKTIFEYKIAGYTNITKLIAVLEYTKTTD